MRNQLTRILLAAVVAIGAMLNAGSSEAASVRSCTPSQRPDLQAAVNFIDSNLTTIVSRLTFLTAAERDEVTRKWSRLKVRCKERVRCKNSGVGGFAHGGYGNKVNICIDNMVDAGWLRRCTVVGTIIHESGHAHGFTMMPGHNNPTANIRANDTMYRMGSDARAFCEAEAAAGRFDNLILTTTTPRAVVGGQCNRNNQCQSDACQAGFCVCLSDSHCSGSNTTCIRRSGANVCAPMGLPSGAACYRNRQCNSGRCRNTRKTCR